MIDKGILTIANDLTIIGIKGVLTMHENHKLDLDNIAYHKEHIFINDL